PALALLFDIAYRSFNVEGIGLICLLFIRRREGHAQRVILVAFFSGVICAAMAMLWPALGMYSYPIDLKAYGNINPVTALRNIELLPELRAHGLHTIVFPIDALVMFPSFHAAMAVFLPYAAWPFRGLRPLIIVLNIAMLLSTPLVGGHYAADVVAGVLAAG